MNFRFSMLDFRLPRRRPAAGPCGFSKSKIQNQKSKICRGQRGSVLVIVIILLLFATFALIAFMERASNDLLVDQRDAITRRLRMEAYSALEVTLAVLNDFREANNGLRSPAEGWNDPLAFAGYTPSEDRTVEIAFEDESGKISLPHVNETILNNLFKTWGLNDTDGHALTDALLGWMKKNHVYTTGLLPDYEQAALPYETPGRSLRSYSELLAIDKVREVFYDADGRPNDLWKRFADDVSLLDFGKPNINGAKPDALAALGQFDATQQQNVTDFLHGAGNFKTQGPGFFQNPIDAARIAGPSGDAGAFGSTISALRIFITVHEGRSQFRLAATIAPPNGATTVTTTATSQRTETSASGTQRTAQQQQQQPNAAQQNQNQARQNQNARNLRYPFTLLEIRENDEIPPPPSPTVTDQPTV